MSEENNLQALSGTGNEQDNSKNKSIYTDNRKNELKIDEIQIGDRDNRRTVFNILGLGDVTIVALVAIVVIFALVVIITQPWTWQQLKSEPKVDSQSSGKSVIQHPHTNSFVGSKKVKVIPEIVSSLGMRFIVVDEGASLYVSEFETRVKDYRAFHKEVPSPAITRSCQAYGVTFSGRWGSQIFLNRIPRTIQWSGLP